MLLPPRVQGRARWSPKTAYLGGFYPNGGGGTRRSSYPLAVTWATMKSLGAANVFTVGCARAGRKTASRPLQDPGPKA